MGRRIIHLVRHGENVPGETKDGLGHGLSERRREQARLTADVLACLPIKAIHSSVAWRALETAQFIAARHSSVQLQKTQALLECVPAIPPSQRARFEPFLSNSPPSHVPHCRERLNRAYVRYFRRVRGSDRHELLICHGNVIRYFVCRALGIDVNLWTRMHTNNCSITRILIPSDFDVGEVGAILEAFNETLHLPWNIRTE